MMSAVAFFTTSRDWLARLEIVKGDSLIFFWKTAQQSLFEAASTWSGPLPPWGMTVDGLLYPLPPSAPTTSEIDGGYWPTPKAIPSGPDYARASRPGSGGDDSATAVARTMFPTPTAQTYGTNQGGSGGRTGKIRPSLDTMARRNMWPTPAAQDAKNSTLPPSQIERDSIPGALLASGVPAGGQLNPEWVEWLMGYPIGWTESAAWAMHGCRVAPAPPTKCLEVTGQLETSHE